MPRLLALCALVLVPCLGCGPRARTARGSPTPEVIGPGLPASAVLDRTGVEPAWYDRNSGRVMRLRDRVATPVQPDRVFGVPSALRVLDDDTVVSFEPDVGLTVHAPGAASIVYRDAAVAFDGVDLESLWFVVWTSSTQGMLCRALEGGGRDCVADLILSPGELALGVAADGSVYVAGGTLQRWDGSTLRTLDTSSVGPAVGFRHGLGPGLLLVTYDAVLAVEGDAVRRVRELTGEQHVVSGSPEHFVVGTFEAERSRTCSGDWFGSPCSSREVWSEWVFTDVRAGVEREIGHQACDRASGSPSCSWTTDALALEEATVVIVGEPLRLLAL